MDRAKVLSLTAIPLSVLIIDFLLVGIMLSSTRLVWRIWFERIQRKLSKNNGLTTKVIILGANETGNELIKHLNNNYPHYSISGFIDNDPKKANYSLSGVPVLGMTEDLETIVTKFETEQVLITTSALPENILNDTIQVCQKLGIKYKNVTSIFDISSKQIQITRITDFQISDLLERAAVPLDLASMENMIHNKRVLVTGAGGSIGSELCRQIIRFKPSNLIMIDIGENYLHQLETDLSNYNSPSENHYVLCSVVNEKKMNKLFEEFKPQLVFHAAAHKHVPLMEENIDEAILNNIQGTKIAVKLAKQFSVNKFILVSTDKVVNPTSIMGMTKCIAEKYVQYSSNQSSTQFISVRFGNVLGTNGSVIPLFLKQIKEGGPITITDPHMERYFMLISEASQLILQAAVLGNGGEVFLLEMGKPVKIIDLAKKMIRLSGYTLEKDIKLQITGIRKGEKLSEELFSSDEKFSASSHQKINVLKANTTNNSKLPEEIDALIQMTQYSTPEEMKRKLTSLISTI
jgi:FlaA1/EpsC-like NDP-sugar epimerase